ncbi:APH(6) family putative aminoglycoside O-phosphotransferase [Paracoccus caeni]|uniref:APH(6) family putative aminoglycoside O-phosphotransferase n=1 Tax=Paracoccus caeni TaxID=657651 RepID=A0A934VZ37_9RHOB|nr:aminoglycoside phosphotransferase family protein [Paracoccus caeni]MBK4214454.1 APH(6) family putative aminoglycoside O-phosphotransferase [Paracoccus caeni]
MFDPWLTRWNLTADGAPITTHTAHLLPVLQGDQPAMLKLSHEPDEREGAAMMAWWNGDGAARVLALEDEALLLERATGPESLADMARKGRDDQATRILCEVAARLHRPRRTPLLNPISLAHWFRDLEPAAATHGGILPRAHQVAQRLLSDQQDILPLHGDLHHDNVLDFGPRGWLAIDPKRLIGDRAFDYASIFTNPDLSDPTRPVATLPGVFQRRLKLVSASADLPVRRLLEWVLAWTGLSAAWYLGDDDPMAEIDLHIANLAAVELDR